MRGDGSRKLFITKLFMTKLFITMLFITMLFITMLFITMCTACSPAGKGEQAAAVSEGAVSSGVTGSAVGENREEETGVSEIGNRFTNDYHYYSYEETGLVQWTRDKKKAVRTYDVKDLDFDELCGVTNEWLYYLADFHFGDSVYRVPIEKGEKGDELNLEKREELFHMAMIWDDVCVFDSCIIFRAVEEGEEWEIEADTRTFYRYDLSTKKVRPLGLAEEFDSAGILFYDEWEECPVMLEGRLLIDTLDKLYSLDPESGKMHFIASVPREESGVSYLSPMKCGDCIYFMPDDKILYQYDGQNLTYISLKKNIQAIISKQKPWGKRENKKYSYYASGIYAYKKRLYISVIVQWNIKDKKQGKTVVSDHTKCLLMSTSPSTHFKLRHESGVAKYLWEDTDILALENGNLIIEYNTLDFYSAPHYASYNMDTGKYKKISAKTAEKYY